MKGRRASSAPIDWKFLFRDDPLENLNHIVDQFTQTGGAGIVIVRPVDQAASVDRVSPQATNLTDTFEGYGATRFLHEWSQQFPSLGEPSASIVSLLNLQEQLETRTTTMPRELAARLLETRLIAVQDLKVGVLWLLTRILAIALLLWVCLVATIFFAAAIAETVSVIDFELTVEGVTAFAARYWLLLTVTYVVLLVASYFLYSSAGLDRLKAWLSRFPSPRRARVELSEELSSENLAAGLANYLSKKRQYVIVVDDVEYLAAADIFMLRSTLAWLADLRLPILVILSFAQEAAKPPSSQVDWALKSLLDDPHFTVSSVEIPLLSLAQITVIITKTLAGNLNTNTIWSPALVEQISGEIYKACSVEMSLPGEDLSKKVPLHGRLDLVLGFWKKLVNDELPIDVKSLNGLSREEWQNHFHKFLEQPLTESDELLAALAAPENITTHAVLRALLTIRKGSIQLSALEAILNESRSNVEAALRDLRQRGILQRTNEAEVRLDPVWRLRLEHVWSDWYTEEAIGERVFRFFLNDMSTPHRQLAEQALLALPSIEAIEVLTGYGLSVGLESHFHLQKALYYLIGGNAAFGKWKNLALQTDPIVDAQYRIATHWRLETSTTRRLRIFRDNAEINLLTTSVLIARMLLATGSYDELINFVKHDWPLLVGQSSKTLDSKEIALSEREIQSTRIYALYDLGWWDEAITEVDTLEHTHPHIDWSEVEVIRARINDSQTRGLQLLGQTLTMPDADKTLEEIRTKLKAAISPRLVVEGLRRASIAVLSGNVERESLSKEGLLNSLSIAKQAIEVVVVHLTKKDLLQNIELLTELADVYSNIGTLFGLLLPKISIDGEGQDVFDLTRTISPRPTWPGFECFSDQQMMLFNYSNYISSHEYQPAVTENPVDKLLRLIGFKQTSHQTTQALNTSLEANIRQAFEPTEALEILEQLPDTFRGMANLVANQALQLALHTGAVRLTASAFREIGFLLMASLNDNRQPDVASSDSDKVAQAATYFRSALDLMEQIGQQAHLPWTNTVLGTIFSDYDLQYSTAAKYFYGAAQGAEKLQYPSLHVAVLLRRASVIYHNTTVLYPELEGQYRLLILDCNEQAKSHFEAALALPKVEQRHGSFIRGDLRIISLELAQRYHEQHHYMQAVQAANDAISHCDDPSGVEQREVYGRALQIKGVALAQQDRSTIATAMDSLIAARNHFADWSQFHEFQILRIISAVLLRVVGIQRYDLTQGDYYKVLGASLEAKVDGKVINEWKRNQAFIALPSGSPPPNFRQSWLQYVQDFVNKYQKLFETRDTLSPELRLELAVAAELLASTGQDIVRYYREAIALYSSVNEVKRALQCLRENLLSLVPRGLYSFEQVMEDLALTLNAGGEDTALNLEVLAEIQTIWRRLSRKRIEIDFQRANRKLLLRKAEVLMATHGEGEAQELLLRLRNDIQADIAEGNSLRLGKEDIEVFDKLYELAIRDDKGELAARYLSEKRQLQTDWAAFTLLELVSLYSKEQPETAARLLEYIKSLKLSASAQKRVVDAIG